MNAATFAELVETQRRFFLSGATRPLAFRTAQLERLAGVLERREGDIYRAVRTDMGRAELETYFMEVLGVRDELRHALAHVRKWVRPRRVRTPLLFFPGASRLHPEPLGVALIMSAWNFPILQLFSPLVGALAAGNTAILKPAWDSRACSHVAREIAEEAFPPELVACVEGDVPVATALLEQRFDAIFFTGSPRVARIVHAAASRHLTPTTLELGGKSPAIVDATADVELAAKRIAWAKFFNAGQICVSVDHAYVHRSQKQPFIDACRHHVRAFFGEDPARSPDYGAIIHERSFDRLVALIAQGKVVHGGRHDRARRYIEPTLLAPVTEDSPLMQEELFGPLLPILEYDDLDALLACQARKEKPLALYLFSRDAAAQQKVLEHTSSGGVTLNDCMSHGGSVHLPFGGVGNSGMGAYHGRHTFDVFTHYKAVLKAPSARLLDLPLKYPPYAGKLDQVRKLARFL